jgi:hypothetical protein
MASTIVEPDTSRTTPATVNLSVFPDGLKTSGQHPPVYSRVRPYSDFPKVHGGPTVWKAEDYRENPELWTHQFTDEEIKELGAVTEDFIQKGLPLTGISKVSSWNAMRR